MERKQFQVTVSSGSFTDLEGVTGDNQAFYDIIYHLEVEPTNAAGLAFNYPADEFEASYSLGRVSSRISVRNSCLEGDGSEDETLHDVTFTLLSEDPDYEGLITFRGENGSVSSISRESLAPGAQLDLVWELAESALYVRAGVAEVEDSANTYTLTLPADCGLVWNGETGMFPTWNSENDNQYILTGVSGDGLVATVLAKTDAEGVTAPAPDSRVPKVQLVDQNGEYMSGGWYLDFTLAAKGMRRAGDEYGAACGPDHPSAGELCVLRILPGVQQRPDGPGRADGSGLPGPVRHGLQVLQRGFPLRSADWQQPGLRQWLLPGLLPHHRL